MNRPIPTCRPVWNRWAFRLIVLIVAAFLLGAGWPK
jgi:hypothetical protein